MTNDYISKFPGRLTLKTYSHLADKKRIPTEYEITSTNMIYYAKNGQFEVNTPLSEWYEKYQKKATLGFSNWDLFNDPKQTTYFSYIKNQKNKEIFFQTSLNHIDVTQYDAQLNEGWINILSHLFAPLRYPWHGLQMISSYLGSMAPEGKIAIVLAFQTMDEMHRIQFVAYRMRQIQRLYPEFGNQSKNNWQNIAEWQDLRRCIEQLLVTYDWLEGLVALNLCVKPLLDYLILRCFSKKGLEHDDTQLDIMFYSFWEDSLWHQEWTIQLFDIILKDNINNQQIIEQWLKKWLDLVGKAVASIIPLFGGNKVEIGANISKVYSEILSKINLQVSLPW